MRSAEAAPGAPSLRRLLLRLVAFTQVPGLLAAAAFLVVYHDAERARTREALMTSTLTLAGALQARLARVERELDALAAQVPASPDDLFAFYQRALYARDAAGADGIVLVDAQSHVLLDTRVPLQPGLPRPTAPELAKPLRSGKPELHDLSLLPGAGVATAGIGVPVVRGARMYALQAELAPRRFQELLEQQHLPRDWLAAVADARGAVVARMPDPELVRGRTIREELRRQMAGRDTGIVEMRSLQGVAVVTAFRRSPATGWITFVSVPQSRLYASVLRSAAWLALLLALAFGATARRRGWRCACARASSPAWTNCGWPRERWPKATPWRGRARPSPSSPWCRTRCAPRRRKSARRTASWPRASSGWPRSSTLPRRRSS